MLFFHSIHKLITGCYVYVKGARSIYETVVVLLENGIEEIKVLQIVILLLTTNNIVKGALSNAICYNSLKLSVSISPLHVRWRILVGLRWFNYVDNDGISHWVFESRTGARAGGSPSERRVFWGIADTSGILHSMFQYVIFNRATSASTAGVTAQAFTSPAHVI
ncbi:unnamed protein product [Orchesella dallaii]|uniref:Mon2/Sec7/BIG1-like dimerisation and cyclophilin-binding domain-containing protein n=1 Tax=Orchesella dallaii TaxID=48710 RepID=A0ABP1R5B3_9HEXA